MTREVVYKLVCENQVRLINRANEILSQLTGEEWTIDIPEWLADPDNLHQYILDGYCKKLKLALDIEPVFGYIIPTARQHMIDHPEIFEAHTDYITLVRFARCIENNILIITIPKEVQLESLEQFLTYELHQLTRDRTWVGAPRFNID